MVDLDKLYAAVKEQKDRIDIVLSSPGIVPTPGYHTSIGMTREQVNQFVKGSIDDIPLGRPGMTDEIAKASCFLPQTTAAI
jgi:NAD(P)-dependent dehydrogenase (short-subunit alcohol dehydrogenase family)